MNYYKTVGTTLMGNTILQDGLGRCYERQAGCMGVGMPVINPPQIHRWDTPDLKVRMDYERDRQDYITRFQRPIEPIKPLIDKGYDEHPYLKKKFPW